MKKLITLSIILLINTLTQAQTPEEMQAWQNYMTPSESHAWLAKYDGEWTVEVKVWMAPGQPPVTATGTGSSKMILGGRYQQTDFKANFMGMPYEGTGLMGYDNAAKKFVATWADSMGTGMIITEGTYDEKTKTLTRNGKTTDSMTGKSVDIMEITQYSSDDKFILQAFSNVDGTEFKTMEAVYTRKK